MGATIGTDAPSEELVVRSLTSVATAGTDRTVCSLQSGNRLTFRIRDVIRRTYEGMGEPPLPEPELTHVLTLMKDRSARLRGDTDDMTEMAVTWAVTGAEPDPSEVLGISSEVGVTVPSASEMETIATYVYHAQLVYEVEETDTIRQALRQAKLELISHCHVASHCRAPYYLCYNAESRQSFLAIRGPSRIAGVLADLVSGVAPVGEGAGLASAHRGFALAAKAIVDEVSKVLRELMVNQGYTITLVGHSLGAGVACVVAKLLHDLGMPVTCYGYGTPPCLEQQAALGMTEYCTSIVHHDDVITRASFGNFKFVGELARRCADAKNSTGKEVPPEDVLHLAQALTESGEAKVAPHHDLYVPGRVVYLYVEDCTYAVACKDGTLRTLRQLELTTSCLADHLCDSYIAATQDAATILAEKASGQFSTDYRPWTVQAVFDSASSVSSQGSIMEAGSSVTDESGEEEG